MYGLQIGMTDLADQNLVTEKLSVLFVRLQKSIENTLKEIYRTDNQNPLYNPLNKDLKEDFIGDKREKDHIFEQLLKERRF